MAYRLAEKGIEAVAFDPRGKILFNKFILKQNIYFFLGFGRTKTTYSGYINSYTDL